QPLPNHVFSAMKIVTLGLLFCSVVNAANIALFLLPISNSHVIFTLGVADELAQDHNVTVVRPGLNPKASILVSKHPRVKEIRSTGVTAESYAQFKQVERKFVYDDIPMYEYLSVATYYKNMMAEICTEFALSDDLMQQMRDAKFDLAIVHHMDSCPVSIAAAAGIPQFGYILSIPIVRMFTNHIGIPILPSIFPSIHLDSTNHMNFMQRLKNFLAEGMMTLVGSYLQGWPIDPVFRDKFGHHFPSNTDLSKKATFLLANVHPDIEYPVALTSKVTYFGGLGMSNESKPLEEPYASFVEKTDKVVFVSFGSVADPKLMPDSWKNAFIHLFKKNPNINFIWRMENDVEVPKNVLRNLWHPQNDLLAHPKVVAFITHAGYNSLGESIASGTPLITVPLFADQFRNSRLAEYRGFGVRVEKTNLTFDSLNSALHTILDNPSYGKSASSLRKIAFSSPVKAGDSLRHAINFALENPDYNRNLPILPFYQLYSLDVIAILLIVPLSIPFLLKWYFWSCCKMAYKEKEKMN
ncbi:hypothetical protein PFISCL1PPCAC_5655, partial [Pristionchus fissidentatus]